MEGRSRWSDADLVRAAVDDDPAAFGELFERWFDRVHDVARNIVRNDDTAAEVAQDVFLTSWRRLGQLEDPERFGGWLLRTSRNRALNRLEKERRARPFEGDVMTGLHDTRHGGGSHDDLVGSNRELGTEAIGDARNHRRIVWEAAGALGERDASLLDLHVRHQLSPAEMAEELGVTANNAHQLLFRLRGKLGDAIANHQVWRDGAPRCAELAALVDGDPFDASTNKIVQRHAKRCEVCGEERQRVVDPTQLFAAVPIVAAPALLRDQAATALAAEGVPVSTSGAPSTAPGTEADGSGDSGGGDGDATDAAADAVPGHATGKRDADQSDAGQSGAGQSGTGQSGVGDTASVPAALPMAGALQAEAGQLEGVHTPAETRRRRAAIVVALVVGVVLLLGAAVTLAGGDEDELVADAPTTDPNADTADDEPDLAVPSTASSPSASSSTTTTARPSTASTAATTAPPPPSTVTTTPVTTIPATTRTTATTDRTPTDSTDGGTGEGGTGDGRTPDTTGTTSTEPPPPAPTIVRFSLGDPSTVIFCQTSTDVARRAVWLTEDATGVELTTPNGTTSFDTSGSHTFCAPSGSVITLTALGPGGSVSSSRTV